jgi:hypothetical protein
MADLNITVKHGQDERLAWTDFEKIIVQAEVQPGRWIRRVEWSVDRTWPQDSTRPTA